MSRKLKDPHPSEIEFFAQEFNRRSTPREQNEKSLISPAKALDCPKWLIGFVGGKLFVREASKKKIHFNTSNDFMEF